MNWESGQKKTIGNRFRR